LYWTAPVRAMAFSHSSKLDDHFYSNVIQKTHQFWRVNEVHGMPLEDTLRSLQLQERQLQELAVLDTKVIIIFFLF